MPRLKWLCCIPRKRRNSRKLSQPPRNTDETSSTAPLSSKTNVQDCAAIPESRRQLEPTSTLIEVEVDQSLLINESTPEFPPEMHTENDPPEELIDRSQENDPIVAEILPSTTLNRCLTKDGPAEVSECEYIPEKEMNLKVKMDEELTKSSSTKRRFDEKNAWSDNLEPKCRRPRSLIAFTTSPLFPKKTRNDLLTPEILQDPEALAALGFGYPSGYGPPYPPFPLDVALSLDSRHRRIISPHDLEVHEACSTSCSVSSGFSSGDRRDSLLDVSQNGVTDGGSEDSSPSSSYTKHNAEEFQEPLPKRNDADLWWMTTSDPVEVPNIKAVIEEGNTFSQEFGCDKSDLLCTIMLFAALEVPCVVDQLQSLPVVRPDPWISDVSDYVLARVVGGQTPQELIRNISELSEGTIYGRFFPTSPLPDVDLQRFLSFWIRKSVIPVLCLNFQGLGGEQSRSLGVECDSTWQYRLVGSVLPNDGRTRLLAPLCDVTAMQLSHWLDTSKTQLISPDSLLYGLTREDSRVIRREAGDLMVLRHLDDELNVIGQVVYLLEIENSDNEMRFAQDVLSRQDGRVRPRMVPQILDVVAPTRMENGILLFARRDKAEVCELIRNLNTPLRDLYA